MSFCLERPWLQQMLTTGQPLETLQRLIIGFWIHPFSIGFYTITQPSLSFWGTYWGCKPRVAFWLAAWHLDAWWCRWCWSFLDEVVLTVPSSCQYYRTPWWGWNVWGQFFPKRKGWEMMGKIVCYKKLRFTHHPIRHYLHPLKPGENKQNYT